MTGKRLREIIQQLRLMFSVLDFKEIEICPAYVSKINLNCEKQIIPLMIPNEDKEGWHYLAGKKLLALLREITSKNDSDFYCLNCLHSCRTGIKLKYHEKVCKNFGQTVLPTQKDNILKL